MNIKVIWRGVHFSKMYFPRRALERIPEIIKIPKCSDFVCYNTVLLMSIFKFDAKNTPYAFKHVPDLFWSAPGPENRV